MPITLQRLETLSLCAQDYAQALTRLSETIRAYASIEPESPSLKQLSEMRVESLMENPSASAKTLEGEKIRLLLTRGESARRRRRRAEARFRQEIGETS